MPDPTDSTVLTNIVGSHFDRSDRQPTEEPWSEVEPKVAVLIEKFAGELKKKPSSLATDQLLNLIYMVRQSQLTEAELADESNAELSKLKEILLRRLTGGGSR